ncbi:SDR family NAD(P)-dependent oxidoreductase, partial [Nocardia xishanensis]
MTLDKFQFDGAHAVLTGAASGMGEQVALKLAALGTHLVLIDRDADRLANVASIIVGRHPSLSVHTEVADLADISNIDHLVSRILADSPTVNLLINNAGVALGGSFAEVSPAEFDWVMEINFRAPVALCRGLLPALRRSPGSHIVNVSSVFGLIGPPGQSAYASSKYALRGFSDVLRHELAAEDIGVTTVHPGGVRTRIAESARVATSVTAEGRTHKSSVAQNLNFPADKAAALILDGVQHRRARVLIAYTSTVPDIVARIFPTKYWAILQALQRR